MELQEIEVFIEKDGYIKIEVHGAKGKSCLDLTKDLEKSLGGQVESREMTYESYETIGEQAPVTERMTQGGSKF